MTREKKTILTDDELKDCEEFRKARIRYRMDQQQWATAIGISYGLVKRIEAHSIKCSQKTKDKVLNYANRCNINPFEPDLHGLESHILCDIFLSHMTQIPKQNADDLSSKCAKLFHTILAYAESFESADTQKTYFQLLEQLLATLNLAIDDMISDINNEENILNINRGLKSVFNQKQISKFKNCQEFSVSKKGEVTSYHHNIFDLNF